jgi:hypothetical protein
MLLIMNVSPRVAQGWLRSLPYFVDAVPGRILDECPQLGGFGS